MTENSTTVRLTPRWVHIWAIMTVAVTSVLLVLGAVVTTFRVGMADPIWPTEPWYLFLIDWQEPSRGFLIEHVHRLAGFAVGAITIVLALGLWWTEPRRSVRWLGLAGLLTLLVGYGQFHREMRLWVDHEQSAFPWNGISVILVGLGGLTVLQARAAWRQVPGWGLRSLGLLALIGVMIQGLLGGFRVALNELMGTDLAAVHGVFAQIVFSLLVGIAILTAAYAPSNNLAPNQSRRIGLLTLLLLAAAVLQLIWGAMIRHLPSGFSQRTHFLTAFLVMGLSVWLSQAIWTSPARKRLGMASGLLLSLLTLQLVLGVEAWLGKFGNGMLLIEMETMTTAKAIIRTSHVFIGTWVLATSSILCILSHWTPQAMRQPEPVAAMEVSSVNQDPSHELVGALSNHGDLP